MTKRSSKSATSHKSALIIGGGPAGCQCALWLKMLGKEPMIVELSEQLGGLQNASPYQNNWVVGMLNTTGRELALQIDHHIKSLDIPVIFNATAEVITPGKNGFLVTIKDKQYLVDNIVIATGVKQRTELSSPNHFDYDAVNRKLKRPEWQAALPTVFLDLEKQLLNEDRFIITDEICHTPIERLYAIGEAANRMPPCVVTSMADGAVAAKAICSKSAD